MEIDEIPVGRAQDLRGKKFGRLTVLYRVKSPLKSGKGTYWKCQCECGNLTVTSSKCLLAGETKSCGCLHKEILIKQNQSYKKNEIGNTYGLLTVIEEAGKDEHGCYLWKCKCTCGKEVVYSGAKLRSGKAKSCGGPCARVINEVGNRYGRLTVLKPAGFDKFGHAKWLCQCDCGNTTIAIGIHLRKGETKSCGCLQKDRVKETKGLQLIGKRFGKLTVIEEVPNQSGEPRQWKCKCDCGNYKIVSTNLLRTGATSSCGCLRSKGETLIAQLLQQHQINFLREYSFKDCCGDSRKLHFDFFINNHYLLEYDGEQHFYAGFGKDSFERTQKYDKIKNEYCKSHNIPLIRIPYWHYDKITIDDLRPETSQFLII